MLAPQLSMLGFSGTHNEGCDGCVRACETGAPTPDNLRVLACIERASELASCGPGIEGALPMVDAIDTCCAGESGSTYCARVCEVMLSSEVAASFFPNCSTLVGG